MSSPSIPQQMGGGMGPGGHPGGPGGRRNNTPLLIGGGVAVVAVAVVIALIVALNSGGGDPEADPTSKPTGKPTSAPTTAQTSAPSDVVNGDPSRTIRSDECTDAHNDLINPGKPHVMTMPDFTSIYVDSVVQCMKEANWPYQIKYMDEQQWGKGTVTQQDPRSLDDFDLDSGKKVTIWVSTGKSAS
jgi:hypothetical protein